MEQEDRIAGFRPTITATISGLMTDALELLVSELTLAKLELWRDFAHLKGAAVAVAIGVGLGFLGTVALVFMMVHLLATFTAVPLWACFGLVGGALALLGALVAASGKNKSKDVARLPSSLIAMKKDFAP